MYTAKNIGKAVKFYRLNKLGMTQKTLASDINLTQSSLSKIENGDLDMNLASFIKLIISFEIGFYNFLKTLEKLKEKGPSRK